MFKIVNIVLADIECEKKRNFVLQKLIEILQNEENNRDRE